MRVTALTEAGQLEVTCTGPLVLTSAGGPTEGNLLKSHLEMTPTSKHDNQGLNAAAVPNFSRDDGIARLNSAADRMLAV